MKKRLISLLLVFTILLSLFPTAALAATESGGEANPFTDVKEGDWCYDAVQYARVNGFFNGTSKTTFTPNGTMTRGMFVTVLGRMAGVDADAYKGRSEFSDVPSRMYYAPYVAWAVKHGITNGTGDGKFSPDALINRQQMATFFVRYFEAFGVDYETGANITTQPADLSKVAPYARDAVLKLWKQGLLNGDGTNFNPEGNASRAQTATLAMRTDKAVKVWYTEPGVESQRVSIDPAAGEAVTPETPATPSKPSGGGSSGGGGGSSGGGGGSGTTTSYYVEFLFGDEQNSTGATLPTSQTYAANTPISQLPTPIVPQGTFFLGWYYDEAMNTPVGVGDCVTKATELYAKFVSGEQVMPMESPNYITQADVPVDAPCTFAVGGISGDVEDAIRFINITGGNIAVNYDVDGSTVSAALEAGQTYQVELTDDAACFILNGNDQSASVRYLNILTAKAEATEAALNEDLTVNDASSAEGLKESVFDGLYQTDSQGNTRTNTTTGTFVSSAVYAVGETVAFTRDDEQGGEVDLTDVASETGDVAYLKIVGVDGPSGGKYTYSYEMADVEDVLFMPDTLPVSNTADADGDADNNSITVSGALIAAAMAEVEAASVDEGDYIAFYSGSLNGESTRVVQYAKIDTVTVNEDDGSYTIAYAPYATEAAYNADLAGDLDVYYEKDKEIILTPQEQDELKKALIKDVEESGYVEQAALYMAAMMLESDDLNEVPDAEKINEIMSSMDVTALPTGDGFALAGGSVPVIFDWKNGYVDLTINKQLEKLNAKGFGVDVRIPFTIKLNDQVSVDVVAEFQEEVVLKQKISTKRHKIGFLKYDYSLNASFEVGNYTGIDFSATVHTDNDTGATEALGKRLETILTVIKSQSEGVNVGTGMDGLSQAYQDLMKSAGDNWVDIIDQQLFCSNGNAFLHIFCWQIKGSFVVSVNLNVAMGMNFEYITHKQYNYSVRVKAKTATNETIDLVPARYSFDFYVMGTLALRAGLRLEMYVGLFSLKLDKIGITAEAGAYVQLWGYFFYHKEWAENLGTTSNSAGAMLVEIGIYIDIRFVAQLFNSSKLTYNPTLYAHQWPLWSAGEVKNVYAFANTDDTSYEFKTVKTLTLPASTYLMKAMDLKTGKISSESKDDESESSFEISFSNGAFSYDAKTNTVTVTPPAGSLNEIADMYIDWEKAPLTFTTAPIRKVIRLNWSDPKGMRYISFDSMGGSAVEGISAGSGGAIAWPANPTKAGYRFVEWCTDRECKEAFSVSSITNSEGKPEMPTFPQGETGMTLYAKWTPDTASYTVEHHWQKLGGGYETEYEGKTGTVNEKTVNSAKSETGFKVKSVAEQTIAADGSTVVKVYYDREKYNVVFKGGYTGAENITKTYVFGAALSAPNMSRTGYTFNGWDAAIPPTMPAEDLEFTAKWKINEYTVTWADSDGTVLETDYDVEYGTTPGYDSAPTKDGGAMCTYTFHSWNTRKDGSGTMWTEDTVVTDHVTFYAQYTCEMKGYTVTWVDDDGSELEKDENVIWGTVPSYDGSTTKAADAQYTYTFDGWYTAAEGGEKVETFDAITGDVTYYARWTATTRQYTVTFYSNIASEITSQTVKYGEKISKPAKDPTRTGCTFGGWYIGETAWDFDNDTVTDTITLYPKWIANDHTITWNTNGGTVNGVAIYEQPVKYGDRITEPDPKPTRADSNEARYAFDGWYTEAEGGEKVTYFGTVTGDETYYAHWNTYVRVYTVDFNSNGGSYVPSQTVHYDEALAKPADPTKTASDAVYTFEGWYTDEACTNAWNFGTDTVTRDGITLYAKWNEKRTINYGLWIGDQQFTSDTLTINGNVGGTATYDPETATLTLNNFNYQAAPTNAGDALIFYYPSGENTAGAVSTLTIHLNGTNNKIIAERFYGLYIAATTNLKFTGEGSLTVSGGDGDDSYSRGIWVANGYGTSTLTVDIGGTLTAQGRTAENSWGIQCDTIDVKRGTVVAKSLSSLTTGRAQALFNVTEIAFADGGYALVSTDTNFIDSRDWASSADNNFKYVKVYSPQ